MDPNGSPQFLSPQWWWLSVIVPGIFVGRWLLTFGRDGGQLTINGQANLITALQGQVSSLNTQMRDQVDRLDRQQRENETLRSKVHTLREYVATLVAQMRNHGIEPALEPEEHDD